MNKKEYRRNYDKEHRKEILARQKRYRTKYPEKQREYVKRYRAKYPEKCRKMQKRYQAKHREERRGWRMKYNYGLPLEDYNRMFAKQNGCCKICGKHQSGFKKRLFVDHDHKTGRIRGLLCFKCNAGIGNFDDDAVRMSDAIKYLV